MTFGAEVSSSFSGAVVVTPSETVTYTTQPNGFIEFGKVMQELGMIDKVPGSQEEIVFDNLK